MISECIILAGGLGTRLSSTVPGIPKCMAPVAGKPFLTYVIEYLQQQGLRRYIFSLGYKHEIIEEFLHQQYPHINAVCSVEDSPLGTGGAIRLACEKARDKNVLVVNGDTLFRIQVGPMDYLHTICDADCTLALKPMKNFDRYGVVELNPDCSIKCFREKQFYENGNINGGIYVLKVPGFLAEDRPEKFSFEKDYLEQWDTHRRMYAVVQDEYFIDIGVPEDYARAQQELKDF